MRLFRTELRRFWGRRIVGVTSLIVLVLTTVIVSVAFTRHSADAPTADNAADRAARDTAQCVRSFMEESAGDREWLLADFGRAGEELTDAEFERFLFEEVCFQDPAWYLPDDSRFHAPTMLIDEWEARTIEDWSADRPDTSTESTFFTGGRQFRQANDGLIGVLPVAATFYLVVAILVGASFVGAEYKSGTVENLLLWEPRRARVLLTKFAAGFVSSVVLTSILLSWLSAGLLILASLRGTTDAIDGRFWIDVASTIGRGALIGGLFFVAAMSVSVIARNTTAAVGAILGWFAVSNFAIELIAGWLRPWEILNNATAFIREGDAVQNVEVQGSYSVTAFHHGYLAAGVVTVAWVGALAFVATALFVRRDID